MTLSLPNSSKHAHLYHLLLINVSITQNKYVIALIKYVIVSYEGQFMYLLLGS